MTKLMREPSTLNTLGELVATAKAMEIEAIMSYESLARQMRRVGKSELEAVFERLAAEERQHLASVEGWSEQTGLPDATPTAAAEKVFDKEGMDVSDPELLSAYRAFSVAVRNEERAFVFWTYVSAHAISQEIAQAAERMAREELGHVATLRRERRLAFHNRRAGCRTAAIPVARVERLLEMQLVRLADSDPRHASKLEDFAQQAWARAVASGDRTLEFDNSSKVEELPASTLAEMLLDWYLGEADKSKEEATQNLAQNHAGQLVRILAAFGG